MMKPTRVTVSISQMRTWRLRGVPGELHSAGVGNETQASLVLGGAGAPGDVLTLTLACWVPRVAVLSELRFPHL